MFGVKLEASETKYLWHLFVVFDNETRVSFPSPMISRLRATETQW